MKLPRPVVDFGTAVRRIDIALAKAGVWCGQQPLTSVPAEVSGRRTWRRSSSSAARRVRSGGSCRSEFVGSACSFRASVRAGTSPMRFSTQVRGERSRDASKAAGVAGAARVSSGHMTLRPGQSRETSRCPRAWQSRPMDEPGEATTNINARVRWLSAAPEGHADRIVDETWQQTWRNTPGDRRHTGLGALETPDGAVIKITKKKTGRATMRAPGEPRHVATLWNDWKKLGTRHVGEPKARTRHQRHRK